MVRFSRSSFLVALLLGGCERDFAGFFSSAMPTDLGTADLLTLPSDGGGADSAPDLAPAVDLAQPEGQDLALPDDLTARLDLLPESDLAMSPDLATPPDFATPPDLAVPIDLAAPIDFAALIDLAAPLDLAAPPDLATPSDLAAPPPDLLPMVLQIVDKTLFKQDVIVNNGRGHIDPNQDDIDRSMGALLTDSAAKLINPMRGNGLPDNGVFAAINNVHPEVRLSYNNNDDDADLNARILKPGDVFTIPIALPRAFQRIQIFATSTEGPSSMRFIFHYKDQSITTKDLDVADWFANPPGQDQFYLIDNLDRMSNGNFEDANSAAIFGINLQADPGKMLAAIEVRNMGMGMGAGWFVYFGALGW